MFANDIATANGALQPPAGYRAAVRFKAGPPVACAAPPAPFTGDLDFPRQYTRPITEMEKGLATLVTKYLETGDASQFTCAMSWLSAWAEADALQGQALTQTGKAMRKWALASLSSAYLRLKFSASNPLREYPAQAERIEVWLGAVADRVGPEWPARAPVSTVNNHYYWAAWSLMATAVATNRRDLFERALAIYRVFTAQVDAEGYLPNELARGSRAASYHSYALLPLSMVAAFGKANGVELADEGSRALIRLAQRVEIALENPASIEARAGGIAQEETVTASQSRWAWLEPYCWTVRCSSAMQSRLEASRPLSAMRLGGNLSAVFSESQRR